MDPHSSKPIVQRSNVLTRNEWMAWCISCLFTFSLLLPGEGNGTPLQYSCLENPMDGGAWKATVRGVTEGRTQLSNFTFTFHFHALRRKWQPTPVFLPGESQGGGAWWAAVYGVAQSRTLLKRLAAAAASTILCLFQYCLITVQIT